MTEYDVTIKGFETGLTATAVESIIRDSFPEAKAVEVEESLAERTNWDE